MNESIININLLDIKNIPNKDSANRLFAILYFIYNLDKISYEMDQLKIILMNNFPFKIYKVINDSNEHEERLKKKWNIYFSNKIFKPMYEAGLITYKIPEMNTRSRIIIINIDRFVNYLEEELSLKFEEKERITELLTKQSQYDFLKLYKSLSDSSRSTINLFPYTKIKKQLKSILPSYLLLFFVLLKILPYLNSAKVFGKKIISEQKIPDLEKISEILESDFFEELLDYKRKLSGEERVDFNLALDIMSKIQINIQEISEFFEKEMKNFKIQSFSSTDFPSS